MEHATNQLSNAQSLTGSRPDPRTMSYEELVEHYWDTGHLPAMNDVYERGAYGGIVNEPGEVLPRHFWRITREMPIDLRKELDNLWVRLSATAQSDRRADVDEWTGRIRDEAAPAADLAKRLPHLYELRAVVPYLDGYANVEITFRQTSRRVPVAPYAELIADYSGPSDDDVHNTFLVYDHAAVRELFTEDEARMLEILVPLLERLAVQRRAIRVPIQCLDFRYNIGSHFEQYALPSLSCLPFGVRVHNNLDTYIGETVEIEGPLGDEAHRT